MSKYSEEVKHIRDNSLVHRMTTKMDDILKREPYSVDDDKLLHDRIDLLHLSGIYDFITEYIEGYEEAELTDIFSMVRLSGSMVVENTPTDYGAVEDTDNIIISVDGLVGWNGYMMYGRRDVAVKYLGKAAYAELTHDQKVIGNNGNEVELQNILIDGDGEFEFRVYNEDMVLISTFLIKYKADDVLSTYNNVLTVNGTAGLTVTLELP